MAISQASSYSSAAAFERYEHTSFCWKHFLFSYDFPYKENCVLSFFLSLWPFNFSVLDCIFLWSGCQCCIALNSFLDQDTNSINDLIQFSGFKYYQYAYNFQSSISNLAFSPELWIHISSELSTDPVILMWIAHSNPNPAQEQAPKVHWTWLFF